MQRLPSTLAIRGFTAYFSTRVDGCKANCGAACRLEAVAKLSQFFTPQGSSSTFYRRHPVAANRKFV